MRCAYVQEATLEIDSGGDTAAPGAAITRQLCGSWEHAGPCLLAPHHTDVVSEGSRLQLRVIFATEPDKEDRVRGMIVDALASGHLTGPDGRCTAWKVVGQAPGVLRSEEQPQANRLAH